MDIVMTISGTPEEFVTRAFIGETLKNSVSHVLCDGLTKAQM